MSVTVYVCEHICVWPTVQNVSTHAAQFINWTQLLYQYPFNNTETIFIDTPPPINVVSSVKSIYRHILKTNPR